MLIREITESKSRLDEIAFMALVPLVSQLLTYGLLAWSAWDIFQAVKRYVDAGGSLTDYNRLIDEVGEEAAAAIRDFVLYFGITRVAGMSWNAFRRAWREARNNAVQAGGAVAANKALDAAGVPDPDAGAGIPTSP